MSGGTGNTKESSLKNLLTHRVDEILRTRYSGDADLSEDVIKMLELMIEKVKKGKYTNDEKLKIIIENRKLFDEDELEEILG